MDQTSCCVLGGDDSLDKRWSVWRINVSPSLVFVNGDGEINGGGVCSVVISEEDMSGTNSTYENKSSIKIEKEIKHTCPGKTIRVFNLLSWSNSDGVELKWRAIFSNVSLFPTCKISRH
jgi:hypothetical protein